MIYAVIDIGSNTIRLSVYKERNGKIYNLFNEKEGASLRSYIENGKLNDKGVERLLQTLNEFKLLINNFDEIDNVYPFATATIRNSSNRTEILQKVKDEIGFEIEIISGEEESKLAFIGANSSLAIDKGVLTDIGGGSSEVVIIEQGKVIKSTSLNTGSLSAYNDYVDFLFPNKRDMKNIEAEIENSLVENKFYKEYHDTLCGVGGSARASLKLYNEYYNLDKSNSSMDRKKLKDMTKDIIDYDSKKLLNLILSVKADRVHTLIPGMIILNKIAKYFDSDIINISQTGVREGYVYSKVLRKE
ncbi:exopolyphosphatase [Anaerococcus sp. WCA-380-WT-2B]|uniref:Exopolyphosphatase n=1 Tax=Anaerococcus porci TaxID=2652269 RepID=A0A6N7VD59_9FIRM|nr:rod shape-determining protein [Anaerococcus porci]MSS77355.1 exopolyphosphatase [Anaerococcus porci]